MDSVLFARLSNDFMYYARITPVVKKTHLYHAETQEICAGITQEWGGGVYFAHTKNTEFST